MIIIIILLLSSFVVQCSMFNTGSPVVSEGFTAKIRVVVVKLAGAGSLAVIVFMFRIESLGIAESTSLLLF